MIRFREKINAWPKELEQKKLNQMFKEVGGVKKARKFIKDKQKRK
ncbi:MAG: hypothetical protein ACRC54_02925 [Fusobacteriaceae bacterium]